MAHGTTTNTSRIKGHLTGEFRGLEMKARTHVFFFFFDDTISRASDPENELLLIGLALLRIHAARQ